MRSHALTIGFGSGSQTVIDTIVNKRLDLAQAREAVAEIKRVGLSVHGTFTYGLPGETAEQMRQTQRYAGARVDADGYLHEVDGRVKYENPAGLLG